MAKLYILESAQAKQQVPIEGGNVMQKQMIVLREIDGEYQYTQRYAVEYTGPRDLRNCIGHIVATNLNLRYRSGSNGAFNNVQCREVVSLGVANN